MSNETAPVSEAECTLCSGLTPDQRIAMRAALLRIPLFEPVCPECTLAFWENAIVNNPQTEEERLRRRAELARFGQTMH